MNRRSSVPEQRNVYVVPTSLLWDAYLRKKEKFFHSPLVQGQRYALPPSAARLDSPDAILRRYLIRKHHHARTHSFHHSKFDRFWGKGGHDLADFLSAEGVSFNDSRILTHLVHELGLHCEVEMVKDGYVIIKQLPGSKNVFTARYLQATSVKILKMRIGKEGIAQVKADLPKTTWITFFIFTAIDVAYDFQHDHYSMKKLLSDLFTPKFVGQAAFNVIQAALPEIVTRAAFAYFEDVIVGMACGVAAVPVIIGAVAGVIFWAINDHYHLEEKMETYAKALEKKIKAEMKAAAIAEAKKDESDAWGIQAEQKMLNRGFDAFGFPHN